MITDLVDSYTELIVAVVGVKLERFIVIWVSKKSILRYLRFHSFESLLMFLCPEELLGANEFGQRC